MGRNTVAIRMETPLPHFSTTVKVVACEKISFSETQNPKDVC